MKCFYSGADAVGICKSCGRGLAVDHLTAFEKGLACKNRCEKAVEELIQLIEENIRLRKEGTVTKLVKGASQVTYASSGFSLFMGSIVLCWGLTGELSFMTWIGSGFIVWGLYNLFRAWRLTARPYKAQ